jgi:hypothetical protein
VVGVTSPGQVVLAHYGGAPEAVTIALPIVLFTGFMLLERRARQRERQRAEQLGATASAADATRDDRTQP